MSPGVHQGMAYKQPESVLIVVCTKDAEVLILQRADYTEFWQSVTGSLRGDETCEYAAIRELKEETGLEVSQGELASCDLEATYPIWPVWRDRYEPGVVLNHESTFRFLLPKKEKIILNPREHLQYQWVTKRNAAKCVTSSSNVNAILQFVPELEVNL